MSVVLAGIECGWLLGLVLAGLLSLDLAALSKARRAPVIGALWTRSPTAAMVAAAVIVILLPGTVIGLLVSIVLVVELRLLAGYAPGIVVATHTGLFLLGAALFCWWALRRKPSHRGHAIVGAAFGIVFGIMYPLLAY